MTQHTPGVWEIEGNWDGGPDMGGWITTPHCVFEINPICGSKPEIVADIRQIAAAPELLDALEAARIELVARGCRNNGTMDLVEAAIAKARNI